MGQKRTASEANLSSRRPQNGRQVRKEKDDQSNGFKQPSGDVGKPRMIFKPQSEWYAAQLPPIAAVEHPNDPRKHLIDSLHAHGDALLQTENEVANKTLFSDSSHKFMTQLMTTGTSEDKVSAYTLSIQESPVHTTKAFEHLLGMSKKKSRNHAIMALAALKDLLSQGLVLPPTRKLRFFAKQPDLIACLQDTKMWKEGDVLPQGLQKIHLIVWAYEDWLKRTYFEMIKTLEGWCNDEIEYTRTRALGFIFELLRDKPEQEENLLRLLVNKMGDKTKKVASRASYLLLQLEQAHPNMKETVTKAIEADVLFRPGQSLIAKYYAIITLNQTVLSTKEQELAQILLDLYFAVFKTVLLKESKQRTASITKPGQKLNRKALKRLKDEEEALQAEEELREKLIAQILTGVNRAFPFADTASSSFESQLDTLYRITHSSNFNTSIQALILIQMITQAKGVITDRYYRTLYESLLDPRLVTSTKQVMYLNLLYKSLKADLSAKRVQAFVKRLIQSLNSHEAPFICSALYLINELGKTFPNIATMLSTPEIEDEDEEEHFKDVPEDGEVVTNGTTVVESAAKSTIYDARKRDPLHTNADRSCLWELLPFHTHYHPSVALFSSAILTGEKMPPKPDPTLHTLIHFLDRFVYRNAKAKGPAMRGSSIMQPLAGNEAVDILIKDRSGASTETPLNTEAFWSRKIQDVPVDEVFFHQYFSQVSKKTSKKAKKEKAAEDGEDSMAIDDSDAGEDEIWNALVGSKPDIEGEGEDEEGYSDMEELMDEDEEEDDDEDGDGFGDGSSEEVEINLESEDDEEESAQESHVAEDDEEGGLTLADLESDEDAILNSDDELPSDIETPTMVRDDAARKSNGKDKKQRKMKLKNLPVFASAEDYAKLIGDSDDE